MKKTAGIVVASLCLVGAMFSRALAQQYLQVECVPPTLSWSHPIISGEPTTLKGGLLNQDQSPLRYQWYFGDATYSGHSVVSDPFAERWVFSTKHRYPSNNAEITYTARVDVVNYNGDLLASVTIPVQVPPGQWETGLEGIVPNPNPLEYEWLFGDGSDSAVGAVTDSYSIEAEHIYHGSPNQSFYATLRVRFKNSNDWYSGTNPYWSTVVWNGGTPECNDIEQCLNESQRKSIALDKALWWAHKRIVRDPITNTAFVPNEVNPGGYVSFGEMNEATTIITAQGFVDNGIKLGGAYQPIWFNPVYQRDVAQLVDHVLNKLVVMPIGAKGDGSAAHPILLPEERQGEMKDGLGVYFSGQDLEYELGSALRLLASCGYAADIWRTWSFSYNNQMYLWNARQILQQMVDFLAWAQLYDYANDYGDRFSGAPRNIRKNTDVLVPDETRGSWPYWFQGFHSYYYPWTMGDKGDVAVGYWTVDGLRAAEKSGAIVPDFVRAELRRFLTNNQDLSGSPDPNSSSFNIYHGEFFFGPARAHHLLERAGEGLVMLQWVGMDVNSPAVQGAVGFINRWWRKHNYRHQSFWPQEGARDTRPCQTPRSNYVGSYYPDDCFSHFAEGGLYEAGYFGDECAEYDTYSGSCRRYQWIGLELIDELNIFGFLTVTEGLQSFNRPYSQTTGMSWLNENDYWDAGSYERNYLRLMNKNQLANGTWDDSAWVTHMEIGHGWSLMLLARLIADMDRDGSQSDVDCDDFNNSIHRWATEIPNNHIDENCNGMADDTMVDGDNDGWTQTEDCDDGNAAIHPGAAEVCNGQDDNCDGQIDENLSLTTTCGVGVCAGTTATKTCNAGNWIGSECDPLAGAKTEICDGLDNDCDGATDESGYIFGAFQQPINADGSSVFKAGQTIPVKISVASCSGAAVANAAVTITVSRTSNQIQGTVEEPVESSGNANEGNVFRYDAEEANYIYNLSTKNYSSGTYKVTAAAGESGGNSVVFSLK